jgi:hypothetical protein
MMCVWSFSSTHHVASLFFPRLETSLSSLALARIFSVSSSLQQERRPFFWEMIAFFSEMIFSFWEKTVFSEAMPLALDFSLLFLEILAISFCLAQLPHRTRLSSVLLLVSKKPDRPSAQR